MITLLLVASAIAASPARDGHVTDLADLIPVDAQSELESQLADYRETSGFDVAILVVPTIGHEDPVDYATAVRKDWELGGTDRNGVLLLVVPPPEKQVAIATGPGARPYLTDDDTIRIKDEVIRPLNREERRVDAVVAGIGAILEDIGPTHVSDRPPRAGPTHAPVGGGAASTEMDETTFYCVAATFVSLFILFLIWLFFPSNRGNGGGYYGGGRGGRRGSGYSSSSTTVFYDSSSYSGGGGDGGGGGGGDGGGGGGGGSD